MLLGRTAANLYWMSRYMERAESMARLLEVGYRISLMPGESEGHRNEWRSTLRSAGCEQSYDAAYDELSAPLVMQHLLFDEANPSSVKSAIRTARDNGRSVRTALTRDVWECLNGTWNELAQTKPNRLAAGELPVLLDWIRQRSLLFRGAILGTQLRNDIFVFSQLGSFVERADNTARILDVKYYILLPEVASVGSEVDNQQWAMVLRSVSAHRSYRWVFRESHYKPWQVAELLMLREEMPRSLTFCYREITEQLDDLARLYEGRARCHATADHTYRGLRSANMTEIFQSGLHEFVGGFIASNNRLSNEIAESYNFP